MTKLPPEIERIRKENADYYVDEVLCGHDIDEKLTHNIFQDGFNSAAEIFMKREEKHLKIIEMQREEMVNQRRSSICSACEISSIDIKKCLEQTGKMLKGEK